MIRLTPRVARRWWLGQIVAVGFAGLMASGAAAGTMRWHRLGTLPGPVLGLACPAEDLCVATGRHGMIATSTDPASGLGAWGVAHVAGSAALSSVSCPSSEVCLATDDAGNVLVSHDPIRPDSWAGVVVDPGHAMGSLDCPTMSLCVALDDSGNVVSSTDPGAVRPSWTVAHIDDGQSDECLHYGTTGPNCQRGLIALSCPSASLCVATDDSQGVFMSEDPAAGGVSWSGHGGPLPLSEALVGLSCPTVSLCVASDSYDGDIWTWNPPGFPTGPHIPVAKESGLGGVWCVSARRCWAETYAGTLLESSAPAGPASGWRPVLEDPSSYISDLACVAILCLAADDAGQIFTATTVRAGRLVGRVTGHGCRQTEKAILRITSRAGRVIDRVLLSVGVRFGLVLPVGRYTVSIRPGHGRARACRSQTISVDAGTVTRLHWPASCLTPATAR